MMRIHIRCAKKSFNFTDGCWHKVRYNSQAQSLAEDGFKIIHFSKLLC